MYKTLHIFLLFLLVAIAADSRSIRDSAGDHKAFEEWTDSYDNLLKKYVASGNKNGIHSTLVDYDSLCKDLEFKKVVKTLEKLPSFDTLLPEEQLAFWINAYNVLILKVITSNPDIQSLNDINTVFSNIWKKKVGLICRRRYSPDEIEHAIIRKQFRDPRAHFALSCGTLSSPDLSANAYRGKLLDDQLNDSVRRFLSNPTKGMVIRKKEILLSRIFKWYMVDFNSDLASWLAEKGVLPLNRGSGDIGFLEYDWSLNKQ